MKNWIKNHCDIYNTYIPLPSSFNLPFNVKSLFKNCDTETENAINLLEGSVKNANITKRTVSEKRKNCRGIDQNGNTIKCEKWTKNAITDNQVWRRLSLQSYKKRKQEREEQKTKPFMPSVLRTYDKRGIQKSTTDWL